MALPIRAIGKLCSATAIFLIIAGLILNYGMSTRQQLKDVSKDEFVDQSSTSNPARIDASHKKPLANASKGSEYNTTKTNWTFSANNDADDYSLDPHQCAVAFPDLYKEIERASKYWSYRKITSDDLDTSWKPTGLVRAMIYDRHVCKVIVSNGQSLTVAKLYVLETKFSDSGYNIHRSLAILSSINRAIGSLLSPVPNVEFTISVSDVADADLKGAGRPVWTVARRVGDAHQWLMPDFGFWSWGLDLVGEYAQIRSQISWNEYPFSKKIPNALWRGAENSQVRRDLLKATQPFKSSWSDVQSVTWSGRTKLSSRSKNRAISIPEHCKWKFLVHTEGVSYSGRGKYLLNCHSVFIAHELEWIENWHHLLVPDGSQQSFVQVKRDFSDLPERMRFLLDNPTVAERIANNSVAAFRDRYLTPAAQACYWRKMIHAWADASFEPQLWQEVEIVNEADQVTGTKMKMRGVPYETHVLTAFDDLYDGCGWFKKFIGSC